ncbi:hypothetical protein PAF18_12530 [Paracoccus sediminicola]|nr:hypothetical protein [Paracoccus sediminicola]WBU58460.1 hypothetical protein PAF18_12530 [Paracoccus sediminicola]
MSLPEVRSTEGAFFEIHDRNDLKTVAVSAARFVRVSILAIPRQNVAEVVNFFGSVEPMTATVSVNVCEAAIFVAVAQVRGTNAQHFGGLGRAEAAQGLALFWIERNFHLTAKRLSKTVCECSDIGRAYAVGGVGARKASARRRLWD